MILPDVHQVPAKLQPGRSELRRSAAQDTFSLEFTFRLSHPMDTRHVPPLRRLASPGTGGH
jgi:hypothetical protein